MLQHFGMRFLARWVVSSLGLWVAAALLGASRMSANNGWKTFVVAGLILALVNMALKPILVILSFPAIILSLGLFMLVINGFLILLVSKLYSSLYIKNLGVAIIAGIIVGLVNFLISKVVEDI
ncbi:phage holin family protein [Candidatus Saccharibacteria bacterium]|nr:phage holin family protein [Candidatus Saccharibacteria bacterium]